MILKEYLNEDVKKINFDESFIKSISWINGGNNVEMIIDWCGQEDLSSEFDFNNIITKLYFEFVTEIDFSFKTVDNSMGVLEIGTIQFRTLNDFNTYEVIIDFYFFPKGLIKFNCNNIKFCIEMNNVP